MNMKRIFLLLLAVSLFISHPARSQYGRPYLAVEREIEAFLLQKYSRKYIASVDPFDTLLVVVRNAIKDEEFLDPYGTLRGKMFFTAWEASEDGKSIPEGKDVFGFSSNGTVLWDSGPLCTSGGTSVIGSSDVNNDGEVDVLVAARDADQDRDYLSYLWIFSWNGTRARILNDVNLQTHQSVLLAGDEWYELFDWEGDGIMEIWAFWDKENALFPDTLMSTRPYVTYSYNGSLYGLWPSTVQIPSGTFLANNRLSVKTTCWVVQSGLLLEYYYRWSNDSTSAQKIRSIFLQDANHEAIAISPPGWLSLLPTKPFNAILWDLGDSQKRRMIKAGQSGEGFELRDTGLPAIIRYFVKGYAPSTIWDEPEHTDEEVRNDILMNSVSGFTIAPKLPPSPFEPLNFLDTLSSYTTQSRSLGWINNQPTADKYLGYFSTARAKLVQRDSGGARTILQQVLHDVDIDSTANLTSEAYALLKFNTEYLVGALPQTPAAPFLAVKLVSSTGINLTGGSLQYYEGSWKDATNNNDGTFSIDTKLKTISLRMTYAYGSQTKSNVAVGADMVVFETVNAQVKLQNSQGALIDTGAVQYYAGAWRSFGTTANGVATKELLPNNYSFRMTYAYASKDKQQDIGANSTVVFQTVNAAVQLQNSQGGLIDQGTVQYYSGAWRGFGTTAGGVATKELLPNNYSFRMTYAFASKDKQQDIGTNPTVIFQTVNAAVELRNSQGSLMDEGTVQYYSGAWRSFGTTANGAATKELLPNNYSFRMTYEFVSNDKAQDLSTSSTVSFPTVLCRVRVKDAQNQPVDGAQSSYYAGAWRPIGATVNGEVTKELLPANLTFRIRYGTIQQDKQQNLSTNTVVEFGIQP